MTYLLPQPLKEDFGKILSLKDGQTGMSLLSAE